MGTSYDIAARILRDSFARTIFVRPPLLHGTDLVEIRVDALCAPLAFRAGPAKACEGVRMTWVSIGGFDWVLGVHPLLAYCEPRADLSSQRGLLPVHNCDGPDFDIGDGPVVAWGRLDEQTPLRLGLEVTGTSQRPRLALCVATPKADLHAMVYVSGPDGQPHAEHRASVVDYRTRKVVTGPAHV